MKKPPECACGGKKDLKRGADNNMVCKRCRERDSRNGYHRAISGDHKPTAVEPFKCNFKSYTIE